MPIDVEIRVRQDTDKLRDKLSWTVNLRGWTVLLSLVSRANALQGSNSVEGNRGPGRLAPRRASRTRRRRERRKPGETVGLGARSAVGAEGATGEPPHDLADAGALDSSETPDDLLDVPA